MGGVAFREAIYWSRAEPGVNLSQLEGDWDPLVRRSFRNSRRLCGSSSGLNFSGDHHVTKARIWCWRLRVREVETVQRIQQGPVNFYFARGYDGLLHNAFYKVDFVVMHITSLTHG
jgi:hypothetical protein